MTAQDDATRLAGWLKANADLKGTPQYEKAATALRNAHLAAMQAGNGVQSGNNITSLDMSQNARLATPEESMRGARQRDHYRDARIAGETQAIAELDRQTPESAGARAGGAGISFLQGLGSNFADEIAGAGAAAGTYLTTGDAERAGQAYSDTRDTVRRSEERYANRHPTEAFLLNMGGGLVTGLAATPRSVISGTGRLGARTVRAGATGLAYGGLAGVGAGEDDVSGRLSSGALGATGGLLLGVGTENIGSALLRAVGSMRSSGPLIDPATGQITRTGFKAIQRVGLTPADVTAPFMLRLEEIRRRAPMAFDANTDAAVNIARGESLPVPVKMTRGQATQDPMILSDEYRMARAGGGGPGRIMRDARGAQEDALRANIPRIQEQLGGPAIARGEGGVGVSHRLESMERADDARANLLYDEARIAGDRAYILAEPNRSIAGNMRRKVETGHALEDVPKTARNISGFERLADTGRASNATRDRAARLQAADDELATAQAQFRMFPTDKQAGARLRTAFANRNAIREETPQSGGATLRELLETRTRLNSIQRDGGQESVAAEQARRTLDANIDEALRNALIEGDQGALAALREANDHYRDFAQRFKSDDLVGALVERDYNNGGRLKVAPEEATNYILGTSDLGMVSKRDLHRDLVKMRTILGDTSQEWNNIRQEAFLRIAQRAEGAQSSDGRTFSGAKLATAWEDFNRKSPEVARVLFSDAERRDIGNFVNVARRVTTLNRDAANPSGTGYAIERLMRAVNATGGLVQKFPVLGRGVAWAADKWKEAGDIVKANSYVSRPLPGATVGAGILNPAAQSVGSAALATWQNERQSRQRP